MVYRPGTLSNLFFDEFASFLEWLSSFSLPIIITGDLNVHLKRVDDMPSRDFAMDGMEQHVHSCTHRLGDTLNNNNNSNNNINNNNNIKTIFKVP